MKSILSLGSEEIFKDLGQNNKIYSEKINAVNDHYENSISGIINLCLTGGRTLLLSTNRTHKNCFVLKILSNKISNKNNVQFYSISYSLGEWVAMLLSREAGVSLERLNNNCLIEGEWKSIARSISILSESNLSLNFIKATNADPIINFSDDALTIIDEITEIDNYQALLNSIDNHKHTQPLLITAIIPDKVQLHELNYNKIGFDEKAYDNIILLENSPSVYYLNNQVKDYLKLRLIKSILGNSYDKYNEIIYEYDKDCLIL